MFLHASRNKRSVVLDLNRREGQEAVLALARRAGVLVYNLQPTEMERMGLRYEAVAAIISGIVYAGAFGFSQRGPYADWPAYDDLIQGMAGIPALVATAAGEPRYAPLVLADRVVALQLANAVLGALLHRARTGRRQRVDVPMFDGLLELVLGEHLAGLAFRRPAEPFGHACSLSREWRPFRTADGHFCLLLYNFLLYNYTRHGRMARSSRRGRPAGGEHGRHPHLLQDEHLHAIGYFREIQHPSEGPILGLAAPSEWSDSPPSVRRHAPQLGEHTEEVLREAGLDAEALVRLFHRSEKI